MFAVEYRYYCDETWGNYEIFATIEEARKYIDLINQEQIKFPLYLFTAQFNKERVYLEDSKAWNYEDCSDTYDSNTFEIVENFT